MFVRDASNGMLLIVASVTIVIYHCNMFMCYNILQLQMTIISDAKIWSVPLKASFAYMICIWSHQL